MNLSEIKDKIAHAAERKAKRQAKAKEIWMEKPKKEKKKKSPSLSKLKKILWDVLRQVVYAQSEVCLTCGSDAEPQACHIVPASESALLKFFLPNIYRGCAACNKAEQSRRGQWVKRFEDAFGADYVNALYQMAADEFLKPLNERFQLKKYWVLEQTHRIDRLNNKNEKK